MDSREKSALFVSQSPSVAEAPAAPNENRKEGNPFVPQNPSIAGPPDAPDENLETEIIDLEVINVEREDERLYLTNADKWVSKSHVFHDIRIIAHRLFRAQRKLAIKTAREELDDVVKAFPNFKRGDFGPAGQKRRRAQLEKVRRALEEELRHLGGVYDEMTPRKARKEAFERAVLAPARRDLGAATRNCELFKKLMMDLDAHA